MNFCTLAEKKPTNTFSHVLYLMHRDGLLYKHLSVRRATEKDLVRAEYLLEIEKDPEDITAKFKDSIDNRDSPYVSFAVSCKNDLVGLYIVTKDKIGLLLESLGHL